MDGLPPGGLAGGAQGWISDEMARERYALPYAVRHYYMPIPDPEELKRLDVDRKPLLPDAAWLDRPFILAELRELETLRVELAGLPDYFKVTDFGLGLGFGEVEGLTYYAMVRKHQPDLIVEFGSGVSTWYAAQAIARALPRPPMVCIEPYPAEPLRPFCAEQGFELIERRVQEFDFAPLLERITGRSIVFIDTTHVLRADGDLPPLLFDLLPRLPKGCLVHLHDIYFPYAVIQRDHSAFAFSHVWNETMALALLLQGNPNWRVVHPGYWLCRHERAAYDRAFPKAAETGQEGSSFWMRKVG